MPMMRYYGNSRTVDHRLIHSHGIILTTYHTVAAEWKSTGKNGASSSLFDVQWKRIVLDEGKSRLAPPTYAFLAA